MNDKELERKRYDERAHIALNCEYRVIKSDSGAASVPRVLRAPYILYEELFQKILKPNFVVLEIASGTGEFTEVLLKSGAKVVASDISEQSLELLRIKYTDHSNLTTIACDMEVLPFPDGIFDVVACAGGLSYGDNQLMLSKIERLLKPGGFFVCVDSLNHNPIYRINRYIHFLRGDRSYSTLLRMPTIDLVRQYQAVLGGATTVRYFGSLSWLITILVRLGFEPFWSAFSDKFDRLFRTSYSAFKFVLICRKNL
jgi:ubiquinone/menaquinone biosynthesis C-methylase UbiE